MPLDPQAQALIDKMAAFEEALPPPPADEREAVIAARDGFEKQSYDLMGAAETMGGIRDIEIPGPSGPLALRIYTPALPPLDGGLPRAVIVYAHGGGWIEGSLDSHDRLVR